MQKTPYDYFAIFDVDYIPSPDFLRVCMRPFFAEPVTAFVQARFDFLNPHENAPVEMQMVTLDAHLDRAGDPLLGRPSAALQRDLWHLAARGDRSGAAGRVIPSPRTST